MAEPEYKRLTRAKLRSRFAVAVTSRSSLWLGPDHLLVIDSNGYQETYKRFYFRDIQAVTITMTKRRLVWNWVLGALTAATLGVWALYFISNRNLDLTLVLIALGTVAAAAVPLLLNNLFGPTCTCHLRTAVQTEQLCPLNRLRRAHKVVNRLRPFIVQAQGATETKAPATEVAPSPPSSVPAAEAAAEPASPSPGIDSL